MNKNQINIDALLDIETDVNDSMLEHLTFVGTCGFTGAIYRSSEYGYIITTIPDRRYVNFKYKLKETKDEQ